MSAAEAAPAPASSPATAANPANGSAALTPNAEGYALSRHVGVHHDVALARTLVALKDHGFAVLAAMDMRKHLTHHTGKPFGHYTILNICLPPLTQRLLSDVPDLGVLLPYHVAVYEPGHGGAVVAMVEPYLLMDVTHRMELQPAADAVRTRLMAALAAV